MINEVTLRAARMDEFALLIAIDDDACTLYGEAGILVMFSPEHPFVVHERQRWRRALESGDIWVACDALDTPLGFAALGKLDGKPYLDQLSVRRSAARRGIGTMLLAHAVRSAGELWLTTYSHLPFNRAFYERNGFEVVPESACGPELCAMLQEQRGALPEPEQRVAMVRREPRGSQRSR